MRRSERRIVRQAADEMRRSLSLWDAGDRPGSLAAARATGQATARRCLAAGLDLDRCSSLVEVARRWDRCRCRAGQGGGG